MLMNFSCNSEQRLCLGNNEVDIHFEQPLSIWHSECDDKVNYSPTTPVLSSITASYDVNVCRTVDLECESLTRERVACTQTYVEGQEAVLTSCLCAPPVLSLAYSCSVLGNVSCIQAPAHLTQMAEYGHCANLMNVLTIPDSVVSNLHPWPT